MIKLPACGDELNEVAPSRPTRRIFMLRNVLAFTAVALIAAACGSRQSLGSGDDNLNTGGTSGSGGGNTGGGGNSVGWDPCSGLPCGAECTVCDPKDPDCNETTVLKFCASDGSCGQAYPECGPPSVCKVDNDCPGIGAPCQECPEGGYACPWTKCENGQCTGGFDSCQGQMCKDDGDCPAILAPCQPCPDGSVSCPWTKCENGQCTGGFDGCKGYDPCGGKGCGDSCTVCPPNDPSCSETAVLKYCDGGGNCAPSYPKCEPTNQCKVKGDCIMPAVCKMCPDGQCAEGACVNGSCGWQCPPPPKPECKVTADCVFPEICKQCPNGKCAQGACLNGSCQLVCSG